MGVGCIGDECDSSSSEWGDDERSVDPVVGAIWHVFHPRDADKIRDLLNKICLEKGEKLEPNTDPIHDQRFYLNSQLRKRLYTEYGVEAYAYPQCAGDVVYIPAGAPHQVNISINQGSR